MKFDVVIVGARCAGAATALLLARTGARVLVVDRALQGSDTTSTHALMRGGVLQWHRWGVLPAIVDAGTPAVRSTTFSYRDQDITVAIEPKFGVSALYAPRLELSRRMLEISDEIASFAWTDSDVQSLHRAFSAEMSREVRALAALGPMARRPAAAASA